MNKHQKLIQLLDKYSPQFGELFTDNYTGLMYIFTGINVESSDYSYTMQCVKSGGIRFYSCVGKLEDIFTKLLNCY